MQYAQQAVADAIIESQRADDIASWLVENTHQEPNQLLAKEGSITGELATLDLSEASDRVSNLHVLGLFSSHPLLSELVQACRSTKADVPGFGEIPLAKFASMGSGLCFPVEAMVFATIVFCGIEDDLNRQLTRDDIKSYKGRVRIYGDDIIVPVEHVSSVIRSLEAHGLKVNSRKSFWTGKFRESCGKEYYDGHDVSIVRVRAVFPSSRRDVKELVSTVSLRNQLFSAGFRSSVEWLDRIIEKIIPFPVIYGYDMNSSDPTTSPLLGKLSDQPVRVEKMDPNLQVPLVRGVVVKSVIPVNQLDDHFALLKWFLKKDDKPFVDWNHLVRSGRPSSFTLKTRWSKPY